MAPCSPCIFAEAPWSATSVVELSSAIVVDAKGTVTVDTGAAKAQPVKMQESAPGKSVPALLAGLGATLRTGPESEATIIIPSAGQVRVGANTEVRLPVLPAIPAPSTAPVPFTAPTSNGQSQMGKQSLELLKGTLHLKIDPAEVKKRGHATFRLKTPAALLAVKGTEFFASSDGSTDTAGVHDGSIYVYEPISDAFISLDRGNVVTISSGQISQPRRLTPQERRADSNYSVTKIRQLVVVARWDPRITLGTTNFSASHPFGTIHALPMNNNRAVVQDLLLDLSSVRGTPVAIQMLIKGGATTDLGNVPIGQKRDPLEESMSKSHLATSLKIQAGLSFAAKAEEHQAVVQPVSLNGFFLPLGKLGGPQGSYHQSLTTLHFPLSSNSTLPKLARIRFQFAPGSDEKAMAEFKQALEYCRTQNWKSIGTGQIQFMGEWTSNVQGIELTGVSILVAD